MFHNNLSLSLLMGGGCQQLMPQALHLLVDMMKACETEPDLLLTHSCVERCHGAQAGEKK